MFGKIYHSRYFDQKKVEDGSKSSFETTKKAVEGEVPGLSRPLVSQPLTASGASRLRSRSPDFSSVFMCLYPGVAYHWRPRSRPGERSRPGWTILLKSLPPRVSQELATGAGGAFVSISSLLCGRGFDSYWGPIQRLEVRPQRSDLPPPPVEGRG